MNILRSGRRWAASAAIGYLWAIPVALCLPWSSELFFSCNVAVGELLSFLMLPATTGMFSWSMTVLYAIVFGVPYAILVQIAHTTLFGEAWRRNTMRAIVVANTQRVLIACITLPLVVISVYLYCMAAPGTLISVKHDSSALFIVTYSLWTVSMVGLYGSPALVSALLVEHAAERLAISVKPMREL